MDKGECKDEIDLTKGDIFDLFYAKRSVVRKGGGTAKNKMCRINPSMGAQVLMKKMVSGDRRLFKYFLKLRDRKPGIAPPPRPK